MNLLNSRMGIALSGSLPLFIISIAIWALKTFLFQVVACSTVTGIVLTIALPVLIVIWILTAFFGCGNRARDGSRCWERHRNSPPLEKIKRFPRLPLTSKRREGGRVEPRRAYLARASHPSRRVRVSAPAPRARTHAAISRAAAASPCAP